MKIEKLRLKNFAGIYAGTGLKEIEIDFSKNKNKMVLLLGANGSSKTVILSNLNPYRTSNDQRKNIILEDEKGLKEITFNHDGTKYEIKHHYGNNSSQNKSFIKKDGEELNENGGIKLFNSIIEKELGVSQEYFAVGRLGDNVNNFIDYTTGERKTYINKFVPNIDKYLEAYKIANDKKKVIDKDLKSLNLDLDRYKDFEDIKKEKENLEIIIEETQKELDELNKEKTSNETKLNSIMEEKYKEVHPNDYKENIVNEIKELNKKLDEEKNLKESNDKLNEYTIESANEKKNTINDVLNTINNDINLLKSEYNNNNNKLEDLNNRKDKIDSRINSINFNESYDASEDIEEILSGYKDSLKEIDNQIKSDRKEYGNKYNSEYDKDNVNPNTLRVYIENAINVLKDSSSFINEKPLFENKLLDNDSLRNKLNNNTNEIERLNEKFNQNNEKVNQIKGKSDLLKILEEKDHEHFNECVFVPLVVDFKDNEYDSIGQMENLSKELFNNISKLKEENKLIENNIELNNKYDRFIKNKSELNEYLSFDLINNEEFSGLLENNSLTDIENRLNEFYNLVEAIYNDEIEKDKLSNTIERKENNFKEDKNNEKILNEYNEDKNEIIKESNSVEESIKENKEKILVLNSKKKKAEENLSIIEQFIEFSERSEEINNQIEEKRKEFKEVTSDLENLSNLYDIIQEKENNINRVKDHLAMKKNELDDTKEKYFAVSTIIKKIDSIEKVLWKYSYVVDSLNPKKDSIPLIFITNYLKDIAVSTNDLLSVAYNDQFKIDFDLTDKDFFINVYKGNGTELQDIKEASQGETALTNISLSLSLLNKVSKEYNILYLDEMDATLDSVNRRKFVDVIDKQIELMGLEQVFLISHNNEFYASDIDLILLKGYEDKIDINDKEVMKGKNILFKVN